MTIDLRPLRVLFQPPAWVTGGISTGDAEFLLELVLRLQPERIVEIGVAAGTSAAALLYALDGLPGDGRVLLSVDVRPTCYFNPRYATGAAAAVIYPAHRSRWILNTDADARYAALLMQTAGTPIDLAFIDANHRHPHPLLDLLQLAPAMRPEAWIALHDIQLAKVHPIFQTYGAQWLFTAWPFQKIAGVGAAENIGAVRLPADLTEIVPVATDLLARWAWEEPPPVTADLLPAIFQPVAAVLRPRLRGRRA